MIYQYWQHFLALESDFTQTTRYVEVCKANFQTYSIEYVKLLLSICSEIDVLAKVTCEQIAPTEKRSNIDDWRICLTKHTQIGSEEVLLRRFGMALQPWHEWSAGQNPKWWRAYNDVKHERNNCYAEANQENCLNALAGLFVMVLYCHKAEGSKHLLQPLPQVLGRDKEPGGLMLQTGYSIPPFS